jgi:hypothetical protein
MILTPLQQIKDNYYKMSESQFHYWLSQNIETLMKEEREMIVNAYNRDVIDGIQDWSIRDGERYYELHVEGKSGKGIYNPVKTSRGNKHTTDENYSFEDGV